MIKNISGIDFEDRKNDDWVKDLRCPNRSPMDFYQPMIKDHLGDLFERDNIKVLEIGCGWGRNAHFFKTLNNVQYYAFDPSETSRVYFEKENLPKDKFYVSDTIDETILNQKYDLIFSIYVLQHVGMPTEKELEEYSALKIIEKLLPCLNSNSFILFHELDQGQNNWNIAHFIQFLISKQLSIFDGGAIALGGGDADPHNLIIAKNG